MRLSELHLRNYARVDGSMSQTFRADEGWAIEVRPELGGVILGRKNRIDSAKQDQMWIPFANCLNGLPVEVPQRAEPRSK